MTNFIVTVVLAFGVFALSAAALSLGRFFGRRRKRRCACAESKAVMKTFFDREKAARQAALYRPDQVNPKELPILSPNLTDPTKARDS